MVYLLTIYLAVWQVRAHEVSTSFKWHRNRKVFHLDTGVENINIRKFLTDAFFGSLTSTALQKKKMFSHKHCLL